MVRDNFETSIQQLKREVENMFDGVLELIDESVESLISKDVNLARKVIAKDKRIDQYMYDIEERTIELIALQQPMAKDLRIIFSISKIITDLERVGDFCVNISKEAIKIGDEEHIKPLVDIPKMKGIIRDMLIDTKESFKDEDAQMAYRIGKEDELVDNLYKDIYTDVLLMIHENSRYINQGTKLLFVGRYLERMADHITNICERIIYVADGDRVDIN